MVKLRIQSSDYQNEFLLPEGSTLIGSASGCRLRLQLPGVQPLHIKCYNDGQGKISLTRLTDTGVVTINARHVPPEQPQGIRPGDQISLGEVVLTLEESSPVNAEPRASETSPPKSQAQGVSFDEAPHYQPGEEINVKPEVLPMHRPSGSLEQVPGRGRPTELFQREGRWFLRDLLTNREVEITPVEAQARMEIVSEAGKSPATDVEATPLAATRRRKQPGPFRAVPSVAAAAGAILFFVLVLVWISQKPPQPPPPPILEYEKEVRKGFESLARDEFSSAQERFQKAQQLIPESKLCLIFSDLTRLETEREDNYRNYPWDTAEHLYQELEQDGEATSDMREFARRRIVFVTTFRIHDNTCKAAKQLLDAGHAVEAFQKVQNIPPDSIVRKRSSEWFEELPRAAARELVEKAQGEQAESHWAKAIEWATQALKFDPQSAAAAAALDASKATLDAEKRLTQARELLASAASMQANPEEMASTLNQALSAWRGTGNQPPLAGTPYEKEGFELAEEILRRLSSLQTDQRAKAIDQLFKQGNGKDSLRLMAEGADDLPGSLLSLKPKIERAVKLHQEAAESDRNEDYEAARRAWENLRDEVADPQNEYHRQAQASLERYVRESVTCAEKYLKRAIAFRKREPAKSRTFCRLALKWDPSNKHTARFIAEMDKKANEQFQMGYNIRTQDKIKAREYFQLAIDHAEEGSEIALKADQELKKLSE